MTTLEIIENAVGIEYLGDNECLDSCVEAQEGIEIQQPHSNKIVNL